MTELLSDIKSHYAVSRATRSTLVRAFANPSIWAALLFRIAASRAGVTHSIARWLLLILFSSDVAHGARFGSGLNLPHPTGIVVGKGSVVGRQVTIYQHVTIGRSSNGAYPTIEDGVTLYAGCVVFGSAVVEENTRVGANQVVGHGYRVEG